MEKYPIEIIAGHQYFKKPYNILTFGCLVVYLMLFPDAVNTSLPAIK